MTDILNKNLRELGLHTYTAEYRFRRRIKLAYERWRPKMERELIWGVV